MKSLKNDLLLIIINCFYNILNKNSVTTLRLTEQGRHAREPAKCNRTGRRSHLQARAGHQRQPMRM